LQRYFKKRFKEGLIMRQALSALLGCFLVFAATGVLAAERAPLGGGHAALKVDQLQFTDEVLENSAVDSDIYIGVEVYGEISPNLYLGGEIGYANPEGTLTIGPTPFGFVTFDNSVTFIPIEVNLKYAIEAGSGVAVGLGGGLSLNSVKEESTELPFGSSASVSDVLLGAQVFADLNFMMNNFFIGLNGKYQVTEDFKDGDYNYNNWRIGGQIGILF
jgi:hypothetical protein